MKMGSDATASNSSSSLDTVAPLRPPSSNTTESVRRQRDNNKRDAVTAHCITSTISNISLETLLQSVEHMHSHLKIKHTTWSSWSGFKTDLTLKGFTEHAFRDPGKWKSELTSTCVRFEVCVLDPTRWQKKQTELKVSLFLKNVPK